MNILELKELLRNNVLVVTFTKRDGSRREMLCSLRDSDIGAEVNGKSKENNEVVVVWDKEANAWRSFRFDSIIDVKIADPVV